LSGFDEDGKLLLMNPFSLHRRAQIPGVWITGLQEFIVNAIKFTYNHGTVNVIAIDKGKMIEITVKDNRSSDFISQNHWELHLKSKFNKVTSISFSMPKVAPDLEKKNKSSQHHFVSSATPLSSCL
jgi:hypothetical protein